MIRHLQLENFRGFRQHDVEFAEFSVVIGRNNAGKSSLIEAIRIVATLLKQLTRGRFQRAPSWAPEAGVGLVSSLADVERKSDAFFHRYSDPPARISVLFENGTGLDVYIGEDRAVHAQPLASNGKSLETRAAVRKAGFPHVAVLPQISPLREKERVLKKAYVEKCLETQLASLHFRNQIRYLHHHYDAFCEMFAATWPGVSVHSFDSATAAWEVPLLLMLREENFVAEVSDFGHGLQMWLQIIWFLSRTDRDAVVVLDEPDVYLHPEQQSALVDLIRGRFRQCIVSTHAQALLDQCHVSEILRLERNLPRSVVGITAHEQEVTLAKFRCEQDKNAGDSIEQVVELSAVLYEEAALSIKTLSGKTVLAMNPDGDGQKQMVLIASQVLHVRIDHPDDLDLYVNREMVPLQQYSGQELAEFTLDLKDF